MLTVNVKEKLGVMLFDSCFPKNDFETKQQKVDNGTGLPLWSVSVLLRQADSRRSESITITVPSAKDPAESLEPLSPVAFEGLRLMTGVNDGRPWVSFRADRVGVPAAATQASK